MSEPLTDDEVEGDINCGVTFEVPDEEINSIKAAW